MSKRNKKLYIWGIGLLCICLAVPFVIDFFNPWPSVKRFGATMIVTGFIFSSSLAIFLKRKEETSSQ